MFSSYSDSNINFIIYNDNGLCLYHKEPINNFLEESFKGILQALYFTGSDLNYSTNLLSSDCGLIAYKKFDFEESSILFCLVFPNNFGDESMAEEVTQNLLNNIFTSLVAHIGYCDCFHFNTSIELEKIKKFFEIYSLTIETLINNYNNPSFLFNCEKRYSVNKEVSISIKNYLEEFKKQIKQDFIFLTYTDNTKDELNSDNDNNLDDSLTSLSYCNLLENSGIIWSSNEWNSIESIDRNIFYLISLLYSSGDISTIPVYFVTTLLENNYSGKVPFKLLVLKLTKNTKLVILSDTQLDTNEVLDVIKLKFDSFFLQRLKTVNIELNTEDVVINNLCSSILLIDASTKSYRYLIDDSYTNFFKEILINTSFCINPINIISSMKSGDKIKLNEDDNKDICLDYEEFSDEFYIKGVDFVFYYLQVKDKFIFVVFSQNVKINEINQVKSNLIKMFDDNLNPIS